MGIVRPKEITNVKLRKKTKAEADEWVATGREVMAQADLWAARPKPLDFIDSKFLVEFLCDDPRCETPHSMSMHQWGLQELYRRLTDDEQRDEKVLHKMRTELDLSRR